VLPQVGQHHQVGAQLEEQLFLLEFNAAEGIRTPDPRLRRPSKGDPDNEQVPWFRQDVKGSWNDRPTTGSVPQEVQ
jgi:hypothetical protein